MKIKKINTIPNGQFIIFTMFIMLILTLVIGIVLIPSRESIGAFVFSMIFVLAIINYISTKHLNYIYFSSEEIRHKKEKFQWENVFITMKHSKPKFSRNSFDYYIYFSNHYLTEEEIKSKEIKKKGLYLVLTKKRAEYILPHYQKEVKILSCSPCAKIILEIVTNHNEIIKRCNKNDDR